MNGKLDAYMNPDAQPLQWAIAELMGHLTLAGRITKPGEYGGLWQIDIPDKDGEGYHTEFFSSGSVYRIRMVSEDIARAYTVHNQVLEYNAPIVTQAEHLAALRRAQEIIEDLRNQLCKALLPGMPAPDEFGDVPVDGDFLDAVDDALENGGF